MVKTMNCAYHKCGKSRRHNPGLRFYTFPLKDEKRMKEWIEYSGNDLNEPNSKWERKVICEDHFTSEDFMNETKHRLTPLAVPLNYLDPVGHAKRKQIEKAKRKEQFAIKNKTEKNNLKVDKLNWDNANLKVYCRPKRTDEKGGDNKLESETLCDPDKESNYFDELLMKRISRSHKPHAQYYFNFIKDLLNSLESLSISEFEQQWAHIRNKEFKSYSKKANDSDLNTSLNQLQSVDENKNDNSDKNTCLVLKENNTVTHKVTKETILTDHDYCSKDEVSPVPDITIKKEEPEDFQIKEETLDFIKSEEDEELPEFYFKSHLTENECCKSLTELSNLMIMAKTYLEQIRSDNCDEDKNEKCMSRSNKNRFQRKRHFNTYVLNYITKTSETEKCNYIINNLRILVRKLRNKVKRLKKQLKLLQSRCTCENKRDIRRLRSKRQPTIRQLLENIKNKINEMKKVKVDCK